MSVAFPVKGPNLISPNGGLNVRAVNASSWVIGCKLQNKPSLLYLYTLKANYLYMYQQKHWNHQVH